ncbi:tRNA glutamyl-Q(34) synthetase GluQRS [Marinicella litoralis]|uniref:Glutamyl-Q tRNA(Asp) synthetase n=1 Tax=Marinicella litoralis TaxID=644220 RepID=A0A4R6XJ48_9GAMM|nr:tRNA glutamyl-Q(34) synthetase GluQRS [Marinicella litoralis]TDR19512.1 glutamyl-Q tRNA(Asp) synthetase [Marinicella litoralis]
MFDANHYRGRFAPSPTGDLHFGSLVAAIVSYCQAKANNGQWLVRIEDVDETRVVEGADKQIIKTLRRFGMESDLPIIYQTDPDRKAAYASAFKNLEQMNLTYPCVCTRAILKGTDSYPGTCKETQVDLELPHSVRLKVSGESFRFADLFQGHQSQNIQQQCGDFNIKRKDGLFCYQLAVVVDDADQGITEVVRGIDIMDSTGRQMYLNQVLNLPQPQYAHFPVITNVLNNKLSKQNHAKAITSEDPFNTTKMALKLLQQEVPVLNRPSQAELMAFAVTHWQPQKLKGIESIVY